MEYLAEKFCNYMIKNGADSEQKAVYIYALLCLMNELLIDSVLLAAAWYMSAFCEMILWIVVFNSLRRNIGGYHAEKRQYCFFSSLIIGILSIAIWKKVDFGELEMIAIIMAAIALIWNMAPVIHPNHPLSAERREHARKQALFMIIFWGICALIF